MIKKILSNQVNRTKAVACIFVAVISVFMLYIVYYSAVFPGFNMVNDAEKEKLQKEEGVDVKATIEGSIVDSNGEIITLAEYPGVRGYCYYDSYGMLVGYNSVTLGRSGLRTKYENYLYKGDKDHKGASIKLTTVTQVQNTAYQAIKGTDGCVVVIENSTGRIIALATSNSQKTLDINNVPDSFSDFPKGSLVPNWRAKMPPGSVIKPLVGTLIYDEGMAKQVYHDKGTETIDGHRIHNANKAVYGNVSLNKAIVKSCNTYFAHMTDEIGAEKLQKRLEAFSIGKKMDFDFDFVTISSEHNLEKSTRSEIADAGYGQGRLLFTPINIAMIGQTIANDGEMLQPYIIDSIYYPKKVLYQGEKNVLGQPCSKEAARYVSSAMLDAAEHYGINRKYNIHAKTGTAEIKLNGKNYNRASFLSFNDKYTVCIVENYTGKAGRNLADTALKIYRVLD